MPPSEMALRMQLLEQVVADLEDLEAAEIIARIPIRNADNVITVGPNTTAYDYDELAVAIAAAPTGSVLVCYPGADYEINANITLTKTLAIVSYAMLAAKTLIEVPAFIPEPEITTAGGFAGAIITLGAAGNLYLGGLSFRYDTTGHIIVGNATAYLLTDRCRFRRDAAALLDPIISMTNGEVQIIDTKLVGDKTHGILVSGGLLNCVNAHFTLTTSGWGINGTGGTSEIVNTRMVTVDACYQQATAPNTFIATNSYLHSSAASAFVGAHAGSDAFFYGTTLRVGAANAPFTSIGAVIWGNGSSCVGNNIAAVGTVTQRSPQSNFETARIDDIINFVTQDNVYYVGQHGSDSNTGLSPEAAVLTFPYAIGLATTAGPGDITDEYAIVGLDAGYYGLTVSVPAFVHVYAPEAYFGAVVTLADDSSFTCRELAPAVNGAQTAVTKSAGSGTAHFRAQRMVLSTGPTNGCLCSPGTLNVVIEEMIIDVGIGFDADGGDINCKLNTVNIIGTGRTVFRADVNTLTGFVNNLTDSGGGAPDGAIVGESGGTLHITAGLIDTAVLYIIDATSKLTMNVTEILSDPGRQAVGGAIVHATWAGRMFDEVGVTAHIGSAQLSGQLIAGTQLVEITISGTAGDCITLPVAVLGMQIMVTNVAAANSADIFPFTGDAINALGVNNAYALASGSSVTLVVSGSNQWRSYN